MTMSEGRSREDVRGIEDKEVAMRDGTRKENMTSGCGSRATDENEESVAPWYLTGNDALDPVFDVEEAMSAVTTATGCAVSRRRARRSSLTEDWDE